MHYGAAWCTGTIQIQIISVTEQGNGEENAACVIVLGFQQCTD
jgi:hypothetical protein